MVRVRTTTADGMLVINTPIEDYQEQYGLFVKREDLSCPSPGPHFSKTRGVYAHIKNRQEKLIGTLDTRHSQAGHAVARACQIIGKQCINYYPEFKHDKRIRPSQLAAKSLGAAIVPLNAGRSSILFHQAKKDCEAQGGYMMPNALKLNESVEETAKEVPKQKFDWVIIPISSGTIAAGVIRGFADRGLFPSYLVHLGYSRSTNQVLRYLEQKSGQAMGCQINLIDEGYQYKDVAVHGPTPPWPCNEFYDLKAFRWWMANRAIYQGKVLFWNIG